MLMSAVHRLSSLQQEQQCLKLCRQTCLVSPLRPVISDVEVNCVSVSLLDYPPPVMMSPRCTLKVWVAHVIYGASEYVNKWFIVCKSAWLRHGHTGHISSIRGFNLKSLNTHHRIFISLKIEFLHWLCTGLFLSLAWDSAVFFFFFLQIRTEQDCFQSLC